MNAIDILPEYLEWANRRALAMARAVGTRDVEQIMAHILGAETRWAGFALGLDPVCIPRPEWDLDECAARIAQSAALYRRIREEVAPESIVSAVTMAGNAIEKPLAGLLLHVFAHGAYHRGQISQEARREGREILDTDFIIFPGLEGR